MKDYAGFTLVELMVVVGIMAVLCTFTAAPFARWLSDFRFEDRASSLQETFKWAQSRAMTGGDADVVNGRIIRQRVYIAVNHGNGWYRVVGWRDTDANLVKAPAEFTLLREGNLGPARFGVLPTVTKAVAGAGAPADDSTFSESACPDASVIPLFAGFRCARFNGKGFLCDGTSSADVYITNGKRNCAVSINAAGVSALYRWTGGAWQFIR